MKLGEIGVWAHGSKLSASLAKELERLGYGAIWIGGSPPAALSQVDDLLGATSHITLATGIVNIWKDDASTTARSYHRIEERFPGRFLLGIGVGHPEATSDYRHPYEALVAYLDRLDEQGVPAQRRVLAALGPRVLRLSRDRAAGAHPYLTTPEHTAWARAQLGDGVLLAPEQKVVLETDPARARELGRPVVAKPYLGLRNYLANLRRLGWTDDDFADEGSDALIDALVAHGDAGAVAARVREHLAAGADHVCVQLITEREPAVDYRTLAAAFFGSA